MANKYIKKYYTLIQKRNAIKLHWFLLILVIIKIKKQTTNSGKHAKQNEHFRILRGEGKLMQPLLKSVQRFLQN